MKNIYISLYKKEGIDSFAKIVIENGFRIFSFGSTLEYLRRKGFDVYELRSELHPNLTVISLLSGTRKIKGISCFDLVVADIPDEIDDEIYNFALITCCVRKNIPVIADRNYDKYVQHIRIYSDISIKMKDEMINSAANLIGYEIAKRIYLGYPYFNENLSQTVIPLKKLKVLKYGENPHQRAFLYKLPFNQPEFEIISGELNTNHYFDIKRAQDILTDISELCVFGLTHSNILFFTWADEASRLVWDIPDLPFHTLVFNGKIDIKISSFISKTRPKMIIARDFDKESIEFLNNQIDGIKLVKILFRIKPPKEFEFIDFNSMMIVQDKDIFSTKSSFKVLSNKKPDSKKAREIEIALTITKHLKTFSSVLFCSKKLVAFSQGQPSPLHALSSVIYKISAVDFFKNSMKNIENFIIAIDGVLTQNMFSKISTLPVECIACLSLDDEREILKKVNEKNIILVVSHKRHYRHI